MRALLVRIYRKLLETFGAQGWWPGDTTEEIIIGAILTQNTNWANVEKAIENLKAAGALSLRRIVTMDEAALAELIKPSGYFRIKARRLISVSRLFAPPRFKGTPRTCSRGLHAAWRHGNIASLRQNLLNTYGIGKETADSILLYAFGRPTFVVDAYTQRFGARHGLWRENASYDFVKGLFESSLPRSSRLFNEYHALFVRLGKTYCKPRPLCYECPLMSRQYFSAREAFERQKNQQR
jgi:endonuclease-3 related protein